MNEEKAPDTDTENAKEAEEKTASVDQRFYETLRPLFVSQGQTDWFEIACCLLRVSGMAIGAWDAAVESRCLLGDIDKLLTFALPSPPFEDAEATRWRLALLAYVHVTEMSAPYHVIANLLRVQKGQRYVINPFTELLPRKKKAGAKRPRPPSPESKISVIRRLAGDRFSGVPAAFDEFYFSALRNAVAHSDYVLDDPYLKIVEGDIQLPGDSYPTSRVELDRVQPIFNAAMSFYRAFFRLERESRRDFGSFAGEHLAFQDGKIEFLVNDEGLMIGFRTHWPSGATSEYRDDGTARVPTNMRFTAEGSVGFIEAAIVAYCRKCGQQLATLFPPDGTDVTDYHERWLDSPCTRCGAKPREMGET